MSIASIYVAQGSGSSSHSGTNYNNYNGGNRYVNVSAGHGGGGSSCRNFNGGHGRGPFAHIQCQICHKYGHETSYCHHRHDDNYVPSQPMDYPNQYPDQNQSQTSANANQNQYQSQNHNTNSHQTQQPHQSQHNQYSTLRSPQANLTSVPSASSSSWYPISGASNHVTNVSLNIHQTIPFEGPDQITIGNGQGLNINSSKLSSFSSPFNPKIPLVLNNLLFVPSINKSLISVNQLVMVILNSVWSNLRSLKRCSLKGW